MARLTDLLPRSPVDSLAMAFTFIMIPVSYLHGVLFVAPTIWPTTDVPDEEREKNLFPYYGHISLMTLLFFNAFTNLIFTMTTDTSCRRVALPIVSQPGFYFCPFCQHYAPPRAHHCPTCKKCILKRDHHCYFAGKCIGYYNQRYFVAFLIHLIISSAYGSVLSFMAVSKIMGGFSLSFLPALVFPLLAWLFQILPINPWVMVETSIALFVMVGAGGLLAIQLLQIYRGQTYYDFSKSDRIYDQGLKKNLMDVLGTNWWFCWLFPFIPSPHVGDGTHYPARIQGRDGSSGSGSGGVRSRDSAVRSDGKRKMVKST